MKYNRNKPQKADINHDNMTNNFFRNMRQLITRKAIFFILFIAEKCFRRDKTAESKGLSGATLSSRIHE